jgi:hypothetical protein
MTLQKEQLKPDEIQEAWYATPQDIARYKQFTSQPMRQPSVNLPENVRAIIMQIYHERKSRIEKPREVSKNCLCGGLTETRPSQFSEGVYYHCLKCGKNYSRQFVDTPLHTYINIYQDTKNAVYAKTGFDLQRWQMQAYIRSQGLKSITELSGKVMVKDSWKKAQLNSAKFEQECLDMLTKRYGENNVLHHQLICYQKVGDYRVFYKIPDFIISSARQGELICYEAKLWAGWGQVFEGLRVEGVFKFRRVEYHDPQNFALWENTPNNEDNIQMHNYKVLLDKIFPEKIKYFYFIHPPEYHVGGEPL